MLKISSSFRALLTTHREIHYQKERRPKTLKKGKKEEEHLGKGEVHGEEAGEREREEEGRLKEREEA